MTRPLAILAILALSACSTKVATSPADGAATSPSPPATTSPATTPPAPPPPPPSAAAASAEPAPTASAAPTATAATEAPKPPEAPLPAVKVANIGMHIGGGPNDDVTKDPIRRSVQPHFDAFRRCFALVEDPKKGGDVGVDLRIDRAGGKAAVSHPRTAIKGKEFKECVVKTFEGIEFLKPRGGTTTVSYSLRFTPAKDGG
jgi:pyruvate/2-oxoglutarate dehydrogenase complex dihydrolipoamide acyltransferase (E2) component